MNMYITGSFIVYLLMMLAIGFAFSSKSKNIGSYYLGGRQMNKWVVALSAQASDMSGWLLMGLPGAVFLSGLSEAWIGIGLGVGTYLNWKIVACRLRKYSHACGDAITIPDFFSNRFRDKTGLVSMVSAAIILVFFTFYTTSGFVACAKLFSETFGWEYKTALMVGVAVIVSYTLLGGFMAVCWTDVIQGAVMFFGIIAVPAVCVFRAGGFEASVNLVNEVNANFLNLFTSASTGKAISIIGLFSSLAWGLGYFGMPHILVRFMAIDDYKNITHSRRIAMGWVAFSLAAACVAGLAGHLYLNANPGVEVKDAENIFMIIVKGCFHPVIVGIMLSAILAAIMSTADSQLLVAASAFCNDFYKKVIRKDASDKELVLISRVTVAVIAVLAGLLAAFNDTEFVKQVMKLVSFAWAGFGAAFGPTIILALFWKRVNLAGTIAGMVVGAGTAILWKFYVVPLADKCSFFGIYEILPGFVLGLIATVVVSLLTPPPSEEIMKEFDEIDHFFDVLDEAKY